LTCLSSCKIGSLENGDNQLNFDPSNISQIAFKNLTCDQRLTRDFILQDPSSISKICKELNEMKMVNNASVNIHHCAYILEIKLKDQKPIETVGIIYTVYHGVIINYNGEDYKNDELEKTLLIEHSKKN
jgi:hypothetical protein